MGGKLLLCLDVTLSKNDIIAFGEGQEHRHKGFQAEKKLCNVSSNTTTGAKFQIWASQVDWAPFMCKIDDLFYRLLLSTCGEVKVPSTSVKPVVPLVLLP